MWLRGSKCWFKNNGELVGLVAAAGGNNVVVVYVRWCVKQILIRTWVVARRRRGNACLGTVVVGILG